MRLSMYLYILFFRTIAVNCHDVANLWITGPCMRLYAIVTNEETNALYVKMEQTKKTIAYLTIFFTEQVVPLIILLYSK